ncbi:MAG: cobalt-zinc-cadmium efflux system protein, partial [Myxococcota bacterium]
MNNTSCEVIVMGHGHDHHHGDSRGALLFALVLNGAFLVVEGGVGWWTGSLALLSDAVHMVGDVAALIIALGAAQVARERPGPDRTFGMRRAEVLGGFVNALAMLLAVAWIVWEAGSRLLAGVPEVAGMPILIVGVVGLAINLGSVAVLLRSGNDDLNVRGALLHMAADALGSVGAIIAAVFVLAGVPAADPIVSVGIAVLVLWSTVHLLRDTGRVLLQLPPPGVDSRDLRTLLAEVPGVASVHDLHLWTLDGNTPIVTAHLVA